MTRKKTCTTCNERKPIELFSKDVALEVMDSAATTVKQPQLNQKLNVQIVMVLTREQISPSIWKLRNASWKLRDADWKHPMKSKDRFMIKHNGTRYVTCPCKHRLCAVKVKECTAYRHMKYGIDHKFPAELKRIEEEKKYWARMMRDCDDSGSERDL